MAKRRVCSKCGHVNAFDATECDGCGVIFRDLRGKDQERRVPESCEYQTEMGERCQYPATMSPSTLGGGPWFCRFHFWNRASMFADQMVEASRDFKRKVVEPTAEELERGAREVAKRFGVDPNLSPKERCLAVLKAWEVAKRRKAA